MAQRSDLRRLRAALEGEWSRLVPRLKDADTTPGGGQALRHEVTESWARSLISVDPGREQAPASDGDAVHQRWTGSPLRRPVDGLADALRSVADDAGFITAVTDESGTILWTYGGRTMRRRAERVNFAPGGRWDEQAMGTNALSLALRTGRPHTVFSAEHLVTALHGWVCYCAPLHGPDGQVLGVLDLSTTWDRSNPLAMSTVRGLASAIEAGLRTEPPFAPVKMSPGYGSTAWAPTKPRERAYPFSCGHGSWRSSRSSRWNRTDTHRNGSARPCTATVPSPPPHSRRRSPICAGPSEEASPPAVTR